MVKVESRILCMTRTELKIDLMGFGMDGYLQVRVNNRTSRPVTIHTFREQLTCLTNGNSITLCTLELVHKVVGFTVSKGDDRKGQIGVRL
jgi:hypothetical protein